MFISSKHAAQTTSSLLLSALTWSTEIFSDVLDLGDFHNLTHQSVLANLFSVRRLSQIQLQFNQSATPQRLLFIFHITNFGIISHNTHCLQQFREKWACIYLLQWIMHLCNMQCFPVLYEANLKIIFMLILYSLSTLFPSAFQFLLPLQMYFSNTGKARQNYSLQVAAPGWLSNVLYY